MSFPAASSSAAALLAAAALFAASPPEAEPERRFRDGVFTSSALPEISIRVDDAFLYLGATTFELHAEARVDRHHWVDLGADGRVERMLIFHFEGFLPESGETYRYRIPPADRAAGADFRFTREPVRLGDADYIHNTWFFDAREKIAASPERELARTAELLADRGLELPGELAMSRFVRVVDAAARHELILFYLEPLAGTGLGASQFVPGGAGAEAVDRLSDELTARSREAFWVERG